MDLRILAEEIISYFRLQEIHVRSVVCFYRSDVAPVTVDLIPIDPFNILVTDENITDEVESSLHRALLNQFNQLAPSDYIDSAGDRVRVGSHRLLLKLFDPAFLIHLQNAEPRDILLCRKFLTHYCNIGFLGDMILEDFVEIQLVHTVACRNDHIRFMTVLEEIKVLVERVRCPPVPEVIIHRHCGGEHIQAALLASEIPPFGG